ncbi:conserved hypothetical protein [Ricinus communis]|uniref:Uncharacterized protein n=1 Tax=Ricinus communis TaxID=3988 RepID=B9SGD7_RICCO|nr:conserved hypothetical protein [Ricinus communis]
MASRSGKQVLVEEYLGLSLEDEDDGEPAVKGGEGEATRDESKWCLVGGFVADRLVRFLIMRNMLASFWRPVRLKLENPI